MIVAYRYPSTPTETDVFEAIYTAVREQSRTSVRFAVGREGSENKPLISLSLPLAPVDLLAALTELQSEGQEFYCENADRAEGIAAGGCLVHWTGSGSDRFDQAQRVAQDWLDQIHEIALGAAPTIRVLCQFAFGDRPAEAAQEPLWPQAPGARLFLPRWQITRQADLYRFTANFHLSDVSPPAALEATCAAIWKRYSRLRHLALLPQAQMGDLRPHAMPVSIPASAQRRQQFLDGVAALLLAIERRRMTKAVLASALDLKTRNPLPIGMALRLLRHSYSGCHVFATRCGSQTFLGASPEQLFRIRQQLLSADAIAGSTARGTTAESDRQLGNALQRSPKELHEHQIVADFIVGQLRQLGLQPSRSSKPQLLRLANIQHLHTPIAARLPAGIHPLQIVSKLHPTPAVAGLPQRTACEAITQQEAFARSLYAGPIGWMDRQRDSEFVVAIRSALVDAARVRLYAGAGIVRGSIPEREWQEVNTKLQAIASVLSL
ncbi:MAG: isochorismate synthase MenF [Elainellaceae cyanobacterium]